MRALYICAILILAGCAAYEDRLDASAAKVFDSVDSRIIHGDTQFAPDERVAAERACSAWTGFTHGRVRLSITWDMTDRNFLDLPGPLLYRVNPTPDTGNEGGRTEGDRIWWFPATCIEWDLQACMMHEIGHMLGLQHFDAIRGQVMSAHNPARVFGAADYSECLRVGVCRETRPDVTTVTVQVDPAIPRVEPQYPETPR